MIAIPKTKNTSAQYRLPHTPAHEEIHLPLIENIDSISPSTAAIMAPNAAAGPEEKPLIAPYEQPTAQEQAHVLNEILIDGRKWYHEATGVVEDALQKQEESKQPPPTAWWAKYAVAGLALTGTMGTALGFYYWRNGATEQGAGNAMSPISPHDFPAAEAMVDTRRRPPTSTTPWQKDDVKIEPAKLNTHIKETPVPKDKVACYETQTFRVRGGFEIKPTKQIKVPCKEKLDNLPRKATTSTAASPPLPTPPSSDDVKAVTLFNTDCLTPGNNMDLTDWLRAAGRALKSPLDSLAQESQVNHYYNTLGIGCPPPVAVQHLQKIMQPIDYVASTLLSLIPGMQAASTAQFIIGPGLELIADYVDGKAMDVEKLDDVSIQMISMMHATLPTLTAKEQVALYKKPNDKSEFYAYGKSILTNRFIFRDGQTHVKIQEQELPLYVQPDGIPWVKDAEGQELFIRYDHELKCWEYSNTNDDHLYSVDNLENASAYSVPMTQLSDGNITNVDSNGIVTVSLPDKDNMMGVFVAGKFIPVRLALIDKRLALTTNSSDHHTQRALLNSAYGWVFDPPSTKVDTSLRTLLESKDQGITFTSNNPVSAIKQKSGLSVNEKNEYYIKKDYEYFCVKKNSNRKSKRAGLSLPGFSSARIKQRNGFLKLVQADEMIFGLRNKKVKNRRGSKPFYIEYQTLNYLKNFACTTASTPAREIAQGIYSDATGQSFLMINKHKFTVSKYDEASVHIRRKDAKKAASDIILWKDGDAYVRVREENNEPSTKYTRYSSCRQARSPGQSSSCLPLNIEDELNAELTQHINSGTVNNAKPNPENLVEVNLFDTPVLYRDRHSAKHYFLYNNAWFEAELVNEHDKINTLKIPELKIFSKGNKFRRKKLIATIIAEKKNNAIEIKKMETFISEKANVSNNIAQLYAANRPYRQLPHIASVEDLVSEAHAANNRFVDPPAENETNVVQNILPSEQKQMMKNSLFPQRIGESKDYIIKIYPMNTDPALLTGFEQQISERVKNDIHLLGKDIIRDTSNAMYNDHPYWPAVSFYFEKAMENSSPIFQYQVGYSYRKRLQKTLKLIKADNIFLVSAVPSKKAGKADFKIDSLLTAEEKAADKTVYISPVDGRIYINAHKVEVNNPVQLITGILRETFRTTGKTQDFFNIPVDEAGQLPVLDAVNAMIDKIKAGTLTSEQEGVLNNLSNRYLKTVSPYHRNKNNNVFKKGTLAYLAKNDSGFRAHLMLNSCDFLTQFTEDIFYRLASIEPENESALITEWIKKYAEAHRDIADRSIVMKIQPQRTGLPGEKVTQTIGKIGEIDGESFLSAARQDPVIADAIAHPSQKCEAIAIPVKNFMEKAGFTNIRFRGMALFLHGGDAAPTNHFAVVGEKDNVPYVFDLTAHQFSSVYEELNGPLILPEKTWAQKYANLEGRRLIKYGDYKEMSDARLIFGPDSKYLSYGPGCKLPGAWVLKRPAWYFPEM